MRRLAYELSKPVFEDKIKLERRNLERSSVMISVRENSTPPCQNLSLDITVTFWEHRSRWVGPKTNSPSPRNTPMNRQGRTFSIRISNRRSASVTIRLESHNQPCENPRTL